MDNIPALFEESLPLENQGGRTDRFEYFKVRKGNTWFFLKRAKDTSLFSNIQRETVWIEFMNRVEAFYPDSHLFGPKIERRIGLDGLVFSFIDAPVVGERGNLEAWQRVLPRYANMLVLFDKIALGWKSDNLPDEPSRSDHPYDLWKHWLGSNIDRYSRLAEARKYIETRSFMLTRCLQHGDLTPWQIFDTPQGWIVYDGEKCGTDLFRYNDLAYGYVRLAVRLGSIETARELLRLFMEEQGMTEEAFKKEFMPVLLHRAIGALGDAYKDQVAEAVTHAEQLVDKCLDKNISYVLGR